MGQKAAGRRRRRGRAWAKAGLTLNFPRAKNTIIRPPHRLVGIDSSLLAVCTPLRECFWESPMIVGNQKNTLATTTKNDEGSMHGGERRLFTHVLLCCRQLTPCSKCPHRFVSIEMNRGGTARHFVCGFAPGCLLATNCARSYRLSKAI